MLPSKLYTLTALGSAIAFGFLSSSAKADDAIAQLYAQYEHVSLYNCLGADSLTMTESAPVMTLEGEVLHEGNPKLKEIATDCVKAMFPIMLKAMEMRKELWPYTLQYKWHNKNFDEEDLERLNLEYQEDYPLVDTMIAHQCFSIDCAPDSLSDQAETQWNSTSLMLFNNKGVNMLTTWASVTGVETKSYDDLLISKGFDPDKKWE